MIDHGDRNASKQWLTAWRLGVAFAGKAVAKAGVWKERASEGGMGKAKWQGLISATHRAAGADRR